MQRAAEDDDNTRPLTDQERTLARWMLQHGPPEAHPFLSQLDRARATLWRCPCGCPTFHFKIPGLPLAPPGVHVLADFIYGTPDDPKGIFIYEKAGILSAVELFSYSGDHPTTLPATTDLRPITFTNGFISHEALAELLARPPLP